MRSDLIWYQSVYHPSAFTAKIEEYIDTQKNVLIRLPKRTPWPDTLSGLIQEKIIATYSNKNMQQLYACSPGESLIEAYCPREVCRLYRKPNTPGRFLAADSTNTTFHSNVFYIFVPDKEDLLAWNSFIKDYASCRLKDRESAQFILVSTLDAASVQGISLPVLSLEDYLEEIDYSIFCQLISASTTLAEPSLKPYLAALAHLLCGNNPELAEKLVREPIEFMQDPEAYLNKICISELDSQSEPFEIQLDPAQIEQKVWEAQIKVVFPIIERYRIAFLERYGNLVDRYLPVRDLWGTPLTEANELELGQIIYCLSGGEDFIDPDSWQRINLFKDVRNTLAHLQILNLETVTEVLRWDHTSK